MKNHFDCVSEIISSISTYYFLFRFYTSPPVQKLISPFNLGERDWLYPDVEVCQKTVCQIMNEFSARKGKKTLCNLMFRKQIKDTLCFYRVKRNTRESLGEHQKQKERILFLKKK